MEKRSVEFQGFSGQKILVFWLYIIRMIFLLFLSPDQLKDPSCGRKVHLSNHFHRGQATPTLFFITINTANPSGSFTVVQFSVHKLFVDEIDIITRKLLIFFPIQLFTLTPNYDHQRNWSVWFINILLGKYIAFSFHPCSSLLCPRVLHRVLLGNHQRLSQTEEIHIKILLLYFHSRQQTIMAENFHSISTPMDFLAGIKEQTELETDTLIVFNAPAAASFNLQLITILSQHGLDIAKNGPLPSRIIYSGVENEPSGDNFHYVKLSKSSVFSLRHPSSGRHRPITLLIPTATFMFQKQGKPQYFNRPLAVSIGPKGFFELSESEREYFKPAFFVTLPPSSSKRRDDAYLTWQSVSKHYVEPRLAEKCNMVLSTMVVWSPIFTKDGSISHDRLAIGTMGPSRYEDVLMEILFGKEMTDQGIFSMNGYLYRFSHPGSPPRAAKPFPSVHLGIELAVIRGDNLSLEFIRDLMYNMGVAREDIMDITFQKDSMCIMCSSVMVAAYIIVHHKAYVPVGSNWSIIPETQCILPSSAGLPPFNPRAATAPIGPYPATIMEPSLFHSWIYPIVLPSIHASAQVPQMVATKSGPGVRPIRFAPRSSNPGGTASTHLSAAQSFVGLDSRQGSPLRAGSHKAKRGNEDPRVLTTWNDILSGAPLNEEHVSLLGSILSINLPASRSLMNMVETLYSQYCAPPTEEEAMMSTMMDSI
jgi:hypothetical protein